MDFGLIVRYLLHNTFYSLLLQVVVILLLNDVDIINLFDQPISRHFQFNSIQLITRHLKLNLAPQSKIRAPLLLVMRVHVFMNLNLTTI